METDPQQTPVDPRGPAWTVHTNPKWKPIFTVDNERHVAVFDIIVFEVIKGYPTAYYTISPKLPGMSLFYRSVYRPTKWEVLSGV